MHTQCPHCRRVQKAPDEYAGRKAKCRHCRKPFRIASWQGQPAPGVAGVPPALSHRQPAHGVAGVPPAVSQRQDRPPGNTAYAPPDAQGPSTPPTPYQAPTPEAVIAHASHKPAPAPAKRAGGLILTARRRTPLPFKTAFLATLGVVSALVLAWYTVRIPATLGRPASSPSSSPSSSAPAAVGSLGMVSGRDAAAAVVACCEYLAVLESLEIFTEVAAESFSPVMWGMVAIAQRDFCRRYLETMPPATTVDTDILMLRAQVRDAMKTFRVASDYTASCMAGEDHYTPERYARLADDYQRVLRVARTAIAIQKRRFGLAP